MARDMTANEIIKAFRCCYLNEDECEDCPCFKDGYCTDVGDVFNIVKQILDLINRQKAEIERLLQKLQQPQADAIKEFAEKLKEEKYYGSDAIGYGTWAVEVADIDNLVKEMTGDNNV